MTPRKVHHTFGAITKRGALTFPSKAEGRLYDRLLSEQREGRVLYFHRQVPIELGIDAAGKPITYRVDFQVFYATGCVAYLDAKGKTTPITREHELKTRLIADRYPFEIELVRI